MHAVQAGQAVPEQLHVAGARAGWLLPLESSIPAAVGVQPLPAPAIALLTGDGQTERHCRGRSKGQRLSATSMNEQGSHLNALSPCLFHASSVQLGAPTKHNCAAAPQRMCCTARRWPLRIASPLTCGGDPPGGCD